MTPSVIPILLLGSLALLTLALLAVATVWTWQDHRARLADNAVATHYARGYADALRQQREGQR